MQLVVLNACCSHEHAKKLVEVVDFAIGHEHELADDSAIEFSGIFYQSLFQEYSLLNSFQLAKVMSAQYRLHGRRDASAFRLKGEDTEMVRFFKENNLAKRAQALCEKLEIEDWPLRDLVNLTEESSHKKTESMLELHLRTRIWSAISNKVKQICHRTAHLCSSPAAEPVLSESDTVVPSDASSASESEDDSCQR